MPRSLPDRRGAQPRMEDPKRRLGDLERLAPKRRWRAFTSSILQLPARTPSPVSMMLGKPFWTPPGKVRYPESVSISLSWSKTTRPSMMGRAQIPPQPSPIPGSLIRLGAFAKEAAGVQAARNSPSPGLFFSPGGFSLVFFDRHPGREDRHGAEAGIRLGYRA